MNLDDPKDIFTIITVRNCVRSRHEKPRDKHVLAIESLASTPCEIDDFICRTKVLSSLRNLSWSVFGLKYA